MTRDLSKTFSFLSLHLAVGFGVGYAFTGSLALAGGIALIEPLVNAVVFFFHERAWHERAWKEGSPGLSLAGLFVHDHAATA